MFSTILLAECDVARVAKFKDSDILTATFPKTGKNKND